MTQQFTIPPRRGIWLYTYEQIRTRHPITWLLTGIFSGIAFLAGLGLLVFLCTNPEAGRPSRDVTFLIAAAILAVGIIDFPASLIYAYRRHRREPIDMWDCETPNDPAIREHLGK